MSTPTELTTEYAKLLQERGQLRKLCMAEWPIMTALVARQRNERLLAIQDRLSAIEQTKGFRQPRR